MWKGLLAPWAVAQLLGEHLTPDAPPDQRLPGRYNHTWLATRLAAAASFIVGRNGDGAKRAAEDKQLSATAVPLYRTFGSQFGATAEALRALPRAVFAHMLRWAYADVHAPQLSLGYRFRPRQKSILLELAWPTLLRASDHVSQDLCRACLPLARRRADGHVSSPHGGPQRGASAAATCRATYYLSAPVIERCNISRWVDNGPHAHCAGTVNEQPDVNDNAVGATQRSVHAWLPDDVRVPWPERWGSGSVRRSEKL